MNNLILVHGLRSKAAVLLGLQRHIESAIPPTRLAVECYGSPGSYLWKNSVLTNGAELASHANSKYPASPIFIVGHSMGGLIARMANLFLWSPARMEQVLINKAPCYGFTKADIAAAQGIAQQLGHVPRQRRPEVKGLVTLATPNSGAMAESADWVACHAAADWAQFKMGVRPGSHQRSAISPVSALQGPDRCNQCFGIG